MNIQEIYKKYHLPINLQKHMYRVAGVAKIVCDNFTKEIDDNLVIETMLLHDMGNLIKFKLDDTRFLEEEDQHRIDELRQLQSDFREAYGHDADLATHQIIEEITDDPRIVQLCEFSHGENASEYAETDEYEKQLSFYSDMRVGPMGVISLNQRFDDLKVRYPYQTKIEDFRQQALLIEQNLQELCQVDLSSIDNSMVKQEFTYLKKINIG